LLSKLALTQSDGCEPTEIREQMALKNFCHDLSSSQSYAYKAAVSISIQAAVEFVGDLCSAPHQSRSPQLGRSGSPHRRQHGQETTCRSIPGSEMASRAGRHQERKRLMGSHIICSIARRMKRSRDGRQRLGGRSAATVESAKDHRTRGRRRWRSKSRKRRLGVGCGVAPS
jgi:hypothetical protein